MRNWHLALYTYEDLGSVEIPLKAVVPRPPLAGDEEDGDDKLKPPPPSLGISLATVDVPANPSRADGERIFSRIVELAKPHNEDSVRRHENLLLKKLAALGPENLDVLLAAATDALRRENRHDDDARHRQNWLIEESGAVRPAAFWRRVVIVACDMRGQPAKP